MEHKHTPGEWHVSAGAVDNPRLIVENDIGLPVCAFASVITLPVLFEAEWGLSLEADLVVTYLYEPARSGGRDRYGWDEAAPELIEIEEAELRFAGRVIDSSPSYDRAAVIEAIKAERKAVAEDYEMEALS